jgi:hypothetical protein
MKTPKRYPMNGPTLEIQRLMQSPRRNAERLLQWLKSNPTMRHETSDAIRQNCGK